MSLSGEMYKVDRGFVDFLDRVSFSTSALFGFQIKYGKHHIEIFEFQADWGNYVYDVKKE